MSGFPLSFGVLGQVSPLLAWAEGERGDRLPRTWSTEVRPFVERERSWLLGELPTYSVDNVDDIVRGIRALHCACEPKAARVPRLAEERRARLDPPEGYDLLEVFRQLNQYFFTWNGTEPCVRDGRMEELHELGIRLPMGHVVRHGHARAVSEGVVHFEEALRKPELITLLPSNSFGLRSVVRRGLSESHLHLRGVTSAEETWANNLLEPLEASSVRGQNPEERRLLVLNLLAGRLLAMAVWLSFADCDEPLSCQPEELLDLLDRIYFARTTEEERWATTRLERKIRQAVTGTLDLSPRPWLGEEAQPSAEGGVAEEEPKNSKGRTRSDARFWDEEAAERPLANYPIRKEFRFLLRWISPTTFHLQQIRQTGRLPGNLPETPVQRAEFVHRLHLAAHLRLVQLTARRSEDRGVDVRTGAPKSSGEDELPDPRRFFLHRALFRYIVCRTHHWQLATQQGKTTGLRHFRTYFGSRQRRPSSLSEVQYSQLVFDRLRQWRGLRVLEGRVSPPRSPHELVPWILAHARPEKRRIEKFGMVVHFIKEDEYREERTLTSKLGSPIPHLRWGKRRRCIQSEAMDLYRMLRQPTPVVPFVVGIDAANLELSTPPEVFAPVFRFLRELPITLVSRDRPFSPYVQLEDSIRRLLDRRRLGMTYHVGEDFRHLLSGLRAICEVVEFLVPQPGDRLGHGTALALNPKDWLEHNGYQAAMPRLEWLDTLVWVHHFLGPGDEVVGELEIEDHIQRLSWNIYSKAIGGRYDPLSLFRGGGLFEPRSSPGRGGGWEDAEALGEEGPLPERGLLDWDWSPLTLWDAWNLRQLDPYSVDLDALLMGELQMRPCQRFTEEAQRWHSVQERVLRSVRSKIGSRNAMLLLALYWLSPEVRREGEKVTMVDMKEQKELWLELCTRVEERMKQLVHEKELVVEVNPSANRIIGPMSNYGQHHVFQLTLDEELKLKRQVRVSVNTDNPAVCNTTLAHEHYLLGEVLMGRGVPEPEVVKWLEWLRQNGEEYNFLHRQPRADDHHMARLLSWLRSIRPSVREARTRIEKLDAYWRWHRSTRLRRLGFSTEQIEADPGLLERMAQLEAELRRLMKGLHEAGQDDADLRRRLLRLRQEMQACRDLARPA